MAWEVLEDELSLPLSGWVDFDTATTATFNNNNDNDNDENHLQEEATRRRLDTKQRLIHIEHGDNRIHHLTAFLRTRTHTRLTAGYRETQSHGTDCTPGRNYIGRVGNAVGETREGGSIV
jgi:hypothetical protein